MSQFRGHWEFDLHRDGHMRHYLGPDVIGTGLTWGENTITGEGIWTNFGYNFTSFSFTSSPTRQLTGGTFFDVGQPIAKIVGVAIAEREDRVDRWAELAQIYNPEELSHTWSGNLSQYDASGEVIDTLTLTRTHNPVGFIDQYSDRMRYQINPRSEFTAVKIGQVVVQDESCDLYVKSKTYGCYCESIGYTTNNISVHTQDIFDSERQELLVIRRWSGSQAHSRREVALLYPM